MQKLQKVQNAAARLIYKLTKRSSVRHEIWKLHWLRVDQRIVYKILLIVYKHYYCISPDYLNNLLKTRDVETKRLELTKYKSKQGRRAFSYVAPRYWNSLPSDIRTITSIDTFKQKIKHILFNGTGNTMNAVNVYKD